MFDDFEVLPDGSFEEVQTCPKCGGTAIVYQRKCPHIEAICSNCGSYIKFVKQWQNDADWSREIKERDKYICQHCGKALTSRQAVAHHKIPRWYMPQLKYDLNNGICLCKACHNQIHGIDGTIRKVGDSE